MIPSSWKYQLKWILKLNIIIWVVNGLLFALLSFASRDPVATLFSSFLSKILLFETGVTFLIGGLLAFTGSILYSKTREYIAKKEENWSIETLKKSEKKANKYLLLALVLFIQSIIVSIIGY